MSSEDKDKVLIEVQDVVVKSLEDVEKLLNSMELKVENILKNYGLINKV